MVTQMHAAAVNGDKSQLSKLLLSKYTHGQFTILIASDEFCYGGCNLQCSGWPPSPCNKVYLKIDLKLMDI